MTTWSTRAASAVALVCATSGAHGFEVDAVAVDGALRPGLPAEVHLAVQSPSGLPMRSRPEVAVVDGEARHKPTPLPPGVSAWWITGPEDGAAARLVVEAEGVTKEIRLPMTPLQPSDLDVPRVIDAVARSGAVRFVVAGPNLPPPDQLRVVASEGRVLRIQPSRDGLAVTFAPDDDPYPRVISLGISDARTDAIPAWATVRVRARLDVPIATDPGAEVLVEVGDRSYGPVVADASGRARLSVDQLPDDVSARVWIVDALGNQTVRSVPLSTRSTPVLLVHGLGAWAPQDPPPRIYLRAIGGDGRLWRGAAPDCRTPRQGDLAVVPVAPAAWVMRLPDVPVAEAWDLRVRCSLSEGPEVGFRVRIADDIPTALRLRVFPEELSADLPIADLQVTLENAIGERLAVEGELDVRAGLGRVAMEPAVGPFFRGVYQGDAAVESGVDEVVASWRPPRGAGDVAAVEISYGEIASSSVTLWARPVDRLKRWVPDVDVAAWVPGVEQRVAGVPERQAAGWRRIELPLPLGDGPVQVVAASGEVRRFGVVVRNSRGPTAPPGPDLNADAIVRIDPGRAADVEVQIRPKVVFAGPKSRADVQVRYLDRSGTVLQRPDMKVEVTEGALVGRVNDPDGTVRYEYRPPAGIKPRTVGITARIASSDIEHTAQVSVRPRPADGIIGLSGGLSTNFGAFTAPTLNLDAEWWVPTSRYVPGAPEARSRLMVRAGVGWHGRAVPFSSSLGDGLLRMDVLPVSLLPLLRQSFAPHAFWAGAGMAIAPYVGRSEVDGAQLAQGAGVLPPGLVVVAGYGLRVGGGELFAEVRGSTLTSPGGPVALRGPVGGLATVAGYRLVYSLRRRSR